MGLIDAVGDAPIAIDIAVFVDIDRPLLRAAAALRARHAIKTPDALQVAAALSAGCRAFVTNDRKLPTIPGLEVIDLGRWAA